MRTRTRILAAAVPAFLVLAGLAGCGGDDNGDGSSALTAAEAKVTAEKKDLAEAQTDFEDASTAFCGSSQTYIASLDRYGDVLTQTAVTVGDVQEAGADLVDPQEDVSAAAEDALDAQQAVVDAEQELAEAQADLKALKKGSTPTTSPSAQPSPTPLAPADTVNRVKQAETELAATQKGITKNTPLVQASQQFNAAVVALEMAWLQLYADAGCLTSEQQEQAVAAVRAYTSQLQQSLHDAGYYEGKVDGVYGPATVDAVEALQTAHGLPTTGTVDKATADALQSDLEASGGAAASQAAASTAAVQQTLKLAGFWDGPVDGEWTPALTTALEEFQTALGVEPTGTVDAATVSALEKAIAELTATPSESPTEESSSAAPSESVSSEESTASP